MNYQIFNSMLFQHQGQRKFIIDTET